MTTRPIHCCGCDKTVQARLTNGAEIYPRLRNLATQPFWKCDACRNCVGCHHKTAKPTEPLGNIPTREIRNARKHIHRILDPLWKEGHIKRGKLYARMSRELGYQYHTGEISNIFEARVIYALVQRIRDELTTREAA